MRERRRSRPPLFLDLIVAGISGAVIGLLLFAVLAPVFAIILLAALVNFLSGLF